MTPHQQVVSFLEEQDALANGQHPTQVTPEPKPVIYDPVLLLNGDRIVIGNGSRIDSFCKLEGGIGLTIGRFVHIASFAHIGIGGGQTIIEDYAAVASGGKIISGSNKLEGLSMSATVPREMQVAEVYTTRLARYAVVLTNAVVLPGVTLHEGAVLAAGSVATKDIPAWEVWGGVPATFIKRRVVR